MAETESREGIVNQTPEKKEQNRHLIIGLHGAIGAGKTELARFLCRESGLVHFEEKYKDNPYLVGFYDDPPAYSFLMESWFLDDKVRQIIKVPRIAKNFGVAEDPDLLQDAEIYASVHHKLGWMTDNQHQKYTKHVEECCRLHKIQVPDMIISVHAPIDTIMARIIKRNRPYEIAMMKKCPEYFAEIARRTEEWVEENRQRVPIMVVDSGNLNYVANSSTQAMLISKLQLEVTKLFGNHPEIKIPKELRYVWPNSDPTVGRSYLRH